MGYKSLLSPKIHDYGMYYKKLSPWVITVSSIVYSIILGWEDKQVFDE